MAKKSSLDTSKPIGRVSPELQERFADFGNPANAGLMDLLGDCVPDTPYRRMNSSMLIKELVPATGDVRVLDIGCGNAKSKPVFVERNQEASWHGVEIAASYNLNSGERPPDGVKIHDGIHIPVPENSFDFCFSNQVFEHVNTPGSFSRTSQRPRR